MDDFIPDDNPYSDMDFIAAQFLDNFRGSLTYRKMESIVLGLGSKAIKYTSRII